MASRGFTLRSVPTTRSASKADLGMLPQLPDTRNEVLSIAKILDADLDRDVFLGNAANEQVVKLSALQKYNIITFATHGLVAGRFRWT